MNEFQNLLQFIYWCSESMHSGAELAEFLIKKRIAGPYAEVSIFPSTGRYSIGKPRVLGLIYDIWGIFASRRVVYLELKEDDFRIHPVINPHLLIHLCKSRAPVSCPGVLAAAVGKRVGFNVWDGSNAPTNLREWTGIVNRKFSPSGSSVEYVLKRDIDGELIKLTRENLVPLG